MKRVVKQMVCKGCGDSFDPSEMEGAICADCFNEEDDEEEYEEEGSDCKCVECRRKREIKNQENSMQKVSTKNRAKTGMENGAKIAAAAMKEGNKLALAGKANQELIGILKKATGDHYPAFFNTEVGEKVAQHLLPGLLIVASQMFPDVSGASTVSRVAELALTDASRNSMAVLLEHVIPLFKAIAENPAFQE